MKPPVLSTRTIKTLRRDLQARRFAVPKLQRNFVWDARRAAKLLDSMYRNMPIGSIFLWEMDRRSAHLIRQSAEVLPSFNTAHRLVWFVIDGQQRLSVIFQAFEGQTHPNDAGRSIDFSRLCFVVRPDGEDEYSPRIVYRKPQGNQFVPIRDILAPDWKPRMPSQAQWFLKRIRDCRERLMNYPVPVVTVTQASLDDIGEVFIRVNSQGMRITSADRAVALMGKLDVRAMAQELRQRVRDEVFALGGIEPILMGFNLIADRPSTDGDPPKLEAMARRWSKRIERDEQEKETFRKLWHRYQDAFLSAVDYLHRKFPVHDEAYLPSANMLATLAVFFYHHRGRPNRTQATEIRKWFWATGVAQRYSGRGYHRNIAADARLFEALANGSRKTFVFREYLDPMLDIQSAEYSSRSARTRAFFCLLASRTPRYLENGDPIPLDGAVVSHSNRRHRHHVFPQAQMKKHFAARTYNGLCNICFLVSRDNLAIGMKLPRSYLADYWNAGRAQFRTVMKSHLIPVGEDSGIWDSGLVAAFKKFRKERLRLICAEFERAAGIRLFTRS
ncbi:MAG: DUF262 domain-containing protein [Acidobacteriota bacterium]